MSFFRSIVIPAADAADFSDAIRRLRREELEGIIVANVYDPAECRMICKRLEDGRHGLVQTTFPTPFRSFFLGMNLNLTPPDLGGYFRAVPLFHERLARLFTGMTDLQTRTTSLLSSLDENRQYVAAPGPRPELPHMFTTLRGHLTGGFIPAHFDNEQESRGSYRLIMSQTAGDIYSFVLALSQAEAGGALEVFDRRHGGARFRMADGDQDASHLSLDGVARVSFRLAPGEMIIFNSGRYLHRVTPVVGTAMRWTACSFMAEGRSGSVLCWG